MITKATLKPGLNGTKRLTAKYGARLVCVRYKYDEAARKRYTTVELIEEESEWTTKPHVSKEKANISPSRLLAVRVHYYETELREKVKSAGGIWRPRHKLWELRYDDIIALGLESRIVADDDPPHQTES